MISSKVESLFKSFKYPCIVFYRCCVYFAGDKFRKEEIRNKGKKKDNSEK